MHVCRSQVYDYLFSWHSESEGLQGGYSPQKTFLHSCVCQTHQMYADACSEVHFDCYRDGIYPYAFGAENVYKHGVSNLRSGKVCLNGRPNVAMKNLTEYKKKKNVTKN